MTDEPRQNFPSETLVQTHLGILQSIIGRMASNSTSAKTWNITIVSAILVAVVSKGKSDYMLLALFPTILFCFLDVYYLGMEKGFRNAYNQFVKKFHNQETTAKDFSVQPVGCKLMLLLEALISFSVWGFYGGLVALIFLAKTYLF